MTWMRAGIAATLLGLLLPAGLARAEEPAAAAKTAGEPAGPYDPDSAWKQSLGYTLAVVVIGGVVIAIDAPIGAVIVGLGVAAGPSIGHFYIERWGHALGFAAMRLGLAVAAGACIVSAIGREPGVERSLLVAGGAVAGAAAVALAIYDIAVLPRHAREANREEAELEVSLRPFVGAGGGGLALAGRF